VVEGQQGGILEREHGEGRHQGVAQGDFDLAGPLLGEGAEMGAEGPEQGVGREVLADFTGSESHVELLPRPKW